MRTGKTVLIVIVVNLGFLAVLGTLAWATGVLALPLYQEGDASAAETDYPAAPDFIGPPSYDSGWFDLGTRPDPISIQFNHNLGGNYNDYVIDLECWDNLMGVYQCVNDGFSVDAKWDHLSNTSISVYAKSALPDAIRVRIWRGHDAYLPVVPKGD
jgi:hypothetical protein